MKRIPLDRRAGFTLLELIVVIGIIGLLISLTVGAVFRVLADRQEKNTNTHLQKLHMTLDEVWKKRLDTIKKESPPQAVIDSTRNADGSIDLDRARAFHLKMRLKQEFPQNFADLFKPAPPIPSATGNPHVYSPRAQYVSVVRNPLTISPGVYIEGYAVDPNPLLRYPESQSAAMLYQIIAQAGISPETIAPTKLMYFSQQNGAPDIQLPVFVDAWGTHIAFRRIADDDMGDVLAELNAPPFYSGQGNADTQDPRGRLRVAGWPNRAALASYLSYPNNTGRPRYLDPFDGTNRGPFCFSAGKDWVAPDSGGSAALQAPDYGFFNANDLYSYRIQQSNKGN